MDFGTFFQYHSGLKRHITERCPMPEPLSFEELERFIALQGVRHQVARRPTRPQNAPSPLGH